MTVRVEGVDHSPFEGVKVYAFDGTTYKGYSGTSGKDGQVTFTLPQGNYRFRGDLNGTQFWSSTENACTLPGCANATIMLPGGNTSRSSVTINYTYDGLSRLTAADYSSGDYYHYAYDSVGNRLTETTAKGETAYTYDTANRLTSVNGQAVQWDDNGNMLADGTAVYTYTSNKLSSVTKGTSTTLYKYSGLGDRIQQIVNGTITNYTLDINTGTGLTQVLDDGTNKYLYGNSRIAQIAETQTGYFLPDALGSMRQMTDSSSDLTLARTYDPYGNVVSSSGAGETAYGYTGEVQSGGLVHLRARDYASQLGRFTSRDTWEGDDINPLSQNQWLYINGNPILFSDPSGNNPNCKEDVAVCAEERISEIISEQGFDSLNSFIQAFQDNELNTIWSTVAGNDLRSRYNWLLSITKDKKSLPTELNYSFFGYFSQTSNGKIRDYSFNKKYQDFSHYKTWNRDNISKPSAEEHNQVGHFLSISYILYQFVIPTDSLNNFNYQIDYTQKYRLTKQLLGNTKWTTGLSVVLGHEKMSDNVLLASFVQPACVNPEDVGNWYHAIYLDESGNSNLRDQDLNQILQFSSDCKSCIMDNDTLFNPSRVGNSLEDLRLDIRAYQFARLIYTSPNQSPISGGIWLTTNLYN